MNDDEITVWRNYDAGMVGIGTKNLGHRLMTPMQARRLAAMLDRNAEDAPFPVEDVSPVIEKLRDFAHEMEQERS